jgi:hypothetical protein
VLIGGVVRFSVAAKIGGVPVAVWVSSVTGPVATAHVPEAAL